jgi:hypothetical protein
VPSIPQVRALVPIEQALLLFVPALAACALVGWWAGGRAFLALAWVALAAVMTLVTPGEPSAFYNLARGWCLLLAGSFGLVCLAGDSRPFLPRALMAVGGGMFLGLVMSLLGPVSMGQASETVLGELGRRNAETMVLVNAFITQHAERWQSLVERIPQLAEMPTETERQLELIAQAGHGVFPALLGLQSLAALGLGWATYHRLGRARLGPPLGRLREFRFNDQLVWGLIVGLIIVLLPTLAALRGVGRNLLVFFGALYAVRGLGVLAWFLTPGSFAAILVIGFVMLWLPVLNAIAVLGFLILTVAAFGLGLGDTWADWRNRARPTSN